VKGSVKESEGNGARNPVLQEQSFRRTGGGEVCRMRESVVGGVVSSFEL